jgi:hypothetical protein
LIPPAICSTSHCKPAGCTRSITKPARSGLRELFKNQLRLLAVGVCLTPLRWTVPFEHGCESSTKNSRYLLEAFFSQGKESEPMSDNEIRARRLEQIKTGMRIRLRSPVIPERGGGVNVGVCSIPFHKCAACGYSHTDIEIRSPDSKFCVHERCYRLWVDMETKPHL